MQLADDQISNPTWARMLAEATGLILAQGIKHIQERKGLYHLAGGGYASRLDWAKEILVLDPNPREQITKEILPAFTKDFPTSAVRPLFSALECKRFIDTFALQLPDWQHALSLAMQM